MSIVRSVATIGFYTLISRVFGFIRDMLIASSLGAGMWADAFLVAFKLPNFMRRLFAEGAFNQAFVPLFAGMYATEGRAEAKKFSEDIFSFLLTVLLIVSVVMMVLMPWVMYVLAPGFSENPEKFQLSITLTRITFPYLIFISLVSLLGGILNSIGLFSAVAATPIIMNLCLIASMLFLTAFTPTPAHALAIGVMISGVAQFVWLQYFCAKQKMLPRLTRPRFTPGVKKLLTLIAPAALGAGVAQINLMVDVIIASVIPSAVSYIYYADRINELPLAVIGIAIGTALLPTLSKQIKAGEIDAAQQSQNRALELAMLFSIPSMVALIVIGEPIVRVLYERGQFGAVESHATQMAMIAFALGLPAFIMVKVFAPGFFAHQDTRTPVRFAIISLLLNIVLNVALMGPLAHVGIALATTISGWVNALMMGNALYKRKIFIPDARLITRLPRIVLSSVGMGVGLWAFYPLFMPYLAGSSWMKAISLTILVGIGMMVYGVMVWWTKATEIGELKRYLTRRRLNK